MGIQNGLFGLNKTKIRAQMQNPGFRIFWKFREQKRKKREKFD